MRNPTGPWSLVRHMWGRNFQQNPVGTVLGSVLAVGALGLLLFFGFFVVMAIVVVGGLMMLAQSFLGTPGGRTARRPDLSSRDGAAFETVGSNREKPRQNNALEGEYTVVDEPGQKS